MCDSKTCEYKVFLNVRVLLKHVNVEFEVNNKYQFFPK
jgi:hypothetical protein